MDSVRQLLGSSSRKDSSMISTPMYKSKASVFLGDVKRYLISYTPSRDPNRHVQDEPILWVKVRNLEAMPLRAAYLAGPYILYVDVRSSDYNQDVAVFSTAERPSYEPQLKPAQSFYAPLYMNRVKDTYTWTVDIISQIIFSTNAEVQFEFLVGRTKSDLHNHSISGQLNSDPQNGLHVSRLDTVDLWNQPTPRMDRPLHVVILTHGLHSNVSADLLYIKEKLDEKAKHTGENLIVRGYFENVCKTEKGVKYLGRRLGDYIMMDLLPGIIKSNDQKLPPIKISFIGHSLGGLVQTFALAHIQNSDPEFFTRYKPENFICLACPFLGISNENPGYIKMALDIGIVGKSGRDLGLTRKPPAVGKKHSKPLLQILPSGPTHVVLEKFKRLTLYANSVNDGIVPLRTSAILYLDWRAIAEASQKEGAHKTGPPQAKQHVKAENEDAQKETESTDITDRSNREEPEMTATEIPEERDDRSQNGNDKNDNPGKDNKQPATDFFASLGAHLQSFVKFIAPQAGNKKPAKIYHRSQVLNEDDDEQFDLNILTGIPKRTSVFESGVSVILPPLPSVNFINDPSSRPETIFHDRYYHETDLPPRHFVSKSSNILSSLVPRRSGTSNSSTSSSPTEETPTTSSAQMKEKAKVEEKIAREWHRNLVWRKVLVQLEPDAHNNIIVRRRFANAYGWPVVDHLVSNHFSSDSGTSLPLNSTIDILRGGQESMNSSAELEPRQSEDLTNFKREERDEPKAKQDTKVVKERVSLGIGWKSHLQSAENESDDEGIVHSMGGLIDSLRDFGSINISRPPDETVEPLEQDTLEERMNRMI